MAEQNINQQSEEEISLKELILKIRKWAAYLCMKKWTIIFAGLIGGALGLTYALIKKPVYTAEISFVLEEGDSGGGLGAYAGIASMMGIDLGTGGGGIFKGDNILQLYKSRKMIQETLLSKDTFANKEQLLIDRYIEFNKLKEEWEEKPELKDIDFNVYISRNKGISLSKKKDIYNQRLLDSVMGRIVDNINKSHLEVIKPDKKLSIINVKVKSEDELFAKSFADNIVTNVNQFYIDTKVKRSKENVQILQHQSDSVRQVLNSSIGGVAAAIDANPNSNPAFQSLRVGSQRKQVDVQASGAVYQELIKNLELSKITLRKERPLIQVIDESVFPLKKDRVGKAKAITLGGIIFGFLAVLFLLVRNIFSDLLS